MTATVERYRPRFISEKRMSPINGCRFSTLAHAVQSVTLGERFTKPNGDRFDVREMTDVMKRLRVASRGGINSTGFNRTEALTAWRTMFPDLADLAVRANDRWSTIVANLKNGHGYSISGNVSEVRAGSPLHRYVNEVGHELWLNAIRADGSEIYVFDPMGPQGVYHGAWVPTKDVKAFSGKYAWDQGRRVTIRFRKGSGTAAAQSVKQIRRIRRMWNELGQLLLKCSSDKETLRERLRVAVRDTEALSETLLECEERKDVHGDVARRDQAAVIADELRDFANELIDYADVIVDDAE